MNFSGRTPAGMSVLGSYLGSMPPLPALVLTHLLPRDEIYQYPPTTPIVASSVLHWLQRVEDGTESPTGKQERTESTVKRLLNIKRKLEQKYNGGSKYFSSAELVSFVGVELKMDFSTY